MRQCSESVADFFSSSCKYESIANSRGLHMPKIFRKTYNEIFVIPLSVEKKFLDISFYLPIIQHSTQLFATLASLACMFSASFCTLKCFFFTNTPKLSWYPHLSLDYAIMHQSTYPFFIGHFPNTSIILQCNISYFLKLTTHAFSMPFTSSNSFCSWKHENFRDTPSFCFNI